MLHATEPAIAAGRDFSIAARSNPARLIRDLVTTAQKHFDNRDFQAPMLLIFLAIGEHEKLTSADLEAITGMPQNSVSRTVIKLGRGDIHYDGLRLVDAMSSPKVGKRRLIELTDKGKAFYEQLLGCVASS